MVTVGIDIGVLVGINVGVGDTLADIVAATTVITTSVSFEGDGVDGLFAHADSTIKTMIIRIKAVVFFMVPFSLAREDYLNKPIFCWITHSANFTRLDSSKPHQFC